ncbi:MAG: 6-phosphogluconolactonase [Verrucomicrobia bacterium]|jgi:6-phosphogluconolactonase|nr:6-phosphogluconolactonase [Verrucomicrobiota bacterium]
MNSYTLQFPPCEIRGFGSADDLAQAAARDWLEWFQTMSFKGREATVALSGGRIAKAFFEAATKVLAGHPDLLGKAHFFWADERCVPSDHPESNFGMAWKHLFKTNGVPETNLHRIPGEIEPELAASTATRGLVKWTWTAPGEVPCLDLVLLGMGEDGHVASLFPGESPEVMAAPEHFRTVIAPKPPSQRITISYSVLARAENIWVLASGRGKEEAWKSSLRLPDHTPLGRVLRSRTHTRIYTDLSCAGPFEDQT